MRFLTAGESHGPGLTVVIDDFPAGVAIDLEAINHDLARRQLGYGRGGRMMIEKDTAVLHGGVRFGVSTGAPIALFIENRDFKNWTQVMASQGERTEAADDKKFVRPRPGHADLAGYYKYGLTDLRDVLERSSARETTARVAAGAVAKALLSAIGVELLSHVTILGGIEVPPADLQLGFKALKARGESNDLRCVGSEALLSQIREHIDASRKAGVTLGGEIEVIAEGLPPGLGSYTQWDRRLDGQLAQAVMSIQAVKAVSIGDGQLGSRVAGDAFHDAITVGQLPSPDAHSPTGASVHRPSNRAGGLEGGVTNGMPLVVRAAMKPIATMLRPLDSINLETATAEPAHFERSDTTAVPACGVVCEAMVATVLARAVMDKFGHDSLRDIQAAYSAYQLSLKPTPMASACPEPL
jgi:chorismate synthase